MIFNKRGLYKAYTSRDESMRSRVLYSPIWKRPNGFAARLSSLTPNCGHEDKKKGEVFKCYAHMFHYLGHSNNNVRNYNRITLVMPSLNCMNENLLEIVSSCITVFME